MDFIVQFLYAIIAFQLAPFDKICEKLTIITALATECI